MDTMAHQHKTTRQIISSFEAKAMRKRTLPVRIADGLTAYFGSIKFFLVNGGIFVAWIVINLGYFRPAIEPFDPFPFILLTMAVSLQAIFLAIIVLMSQNRQGYISSVRDELILQTNLIAEREITKALHLLSDLHKHHGVKRPSDPELESMLKDTDISYIERKLEEQIQGAPPPTLTQVVTEPIIKISETVTNALQAPLNGSQNHTEGNPNNANGNGKKNGSHPIRVGLGKPEQSKAHTMS